MWIVLLVMIAGILFFIFRNKNTDISNQTQDLNSQIVSTPTPESNQASSSVQPTGLQIEDIKLGEGKEVKAGDTITMHYKGTLLNGTKFDNSYDRGKPFETKIGVGEVIKGWDQGVIGMKVGGKRKLIIPPDLGYGIREIGNIPANSTLVFELELLAIK